MWKKTQLRVDPADGNAYSLDSFLECYGEHEGQRRWGSAGQQPAGVSLLHDLMAFVCLSTYPVPLGSLPVFHYFAARNTGSLPVFHYCII